MCFSSQIDNVFCHCVAPLCNCEMSQCELLRLNANYFTGLLTDFVHCTTNSAASEQEKKPLDSIASLSFLSRLVILGAVKFVSS